MTRRKKPSLGKPEKLYLSPDEAAASDRLNMAIDKKATNGALKCQTPVLKERGDGGVTDYYPHMDYDERIPPSEEDARRMCLDCPVIRECFMLATTLRPTTGVWGGVTWLEGRPL